MLDFRPLYESMKRSHRVRRMRPGNAEHKRHWTPPRGPRHNPRVTITSNLTFQEI